MQSSNSDARKLKLAATEGSATYLGTIGLYGSVAAAFRPRGFEATIFFVCAGDRGAIPWRSTVSTHPAEWRAFSRPV